MERHHVQKWYGDEIVRLKQHGFYNYLRNHISQRPPHRGVGEGVGDVQGGIATGQGIGSVRHDAEHSYGVHDGTAYGGARGTGGNNTCAALGGVPDHGGPSGPKSSMGNMSSGSGVVASTSSTSSSGGTSTTPHSASNVAFNIPINFNVVVLILGPNNPTFFFLCPPAKLKLTTYTDSMGAATSRNFNDITMTAVADVTSTVENKAGANCEQSMYVNAPRIEGNTFKQNCTMNLEQLNAQLEKSKVQQGISAKIAQEAKSVVSGVNLGQFTYAENMTDLASSATVNIANNVKQACTAASLQTIGIQADDVKDNIFGQDSTILSSCVQKAVQDNAALQKLAAEVKQVSTAESKGISVWAIVALALIGLLIIGAPFLGVLGAAGLLMKSTINIITKLLPILIMVTGVVFLIVYSTSIDTSVEGYGYSPLLSSEVGTRCLGAGKALPVVGKEQQKISDNGFPTADSVGLQCKTNPQCKAFDYDVKKSKTYTFYTDYNAPQCLITLKDKKTEDGPNKGESLAVDDTVMTSRPNIYATWDRPTQKILKEVPALKKGDFIVVVGWDGDPRRDEDGRIYTVGEGHEAIHKADLVNRNDREKPITSVYMNRFGPSPYFEGGDVNLFKHLDMLTTRERTAYKQLTRPHLDTGTIEIRWGDYDEKSKHCTLEYNKINPTANDHWIPIKGVVDDVVRADVQDVNWSGFKYTTHRYPWMLWAGTIITSLGFLITCWTFLGGKKTAATKASIKSKQPP